MSTLPPNLAFNRRVPFEALVKSDIELLLSVVKELSYLREVQGVIDVVRRAARDLTGADGVTFVLREGEQVHYADENAIGPLWKGRRFPIGACISGWAILNKRSVLIEDIYADSRIPLDAYRPTFVKSLAMVPIREEDPLGAIGAYWATRHMPTTREVELLESLAATTAVALANAELFQQAQQAIRVRDDFLSIASHELKTPLTPLKLQLQAVRRGLERNGGGSPQLNESLPRTLGYVRRLEALVDNLLDLSRISQGRLRLQPEELDLSAVAREVAAGFAEELARSASALTVRADAPAVGRWDRVRIEHIVQKLLANAIKYGEGKPIAIEVWTEPGCAVLSVEDHGIGISPEDQARMFQRFERAVSVRHFGGFGIGLWIARQLVEAHGGSIALTSAPGAGSTFVVRLPIR